MRLSNLYLMSLLEAAEDDKEKEDEKKKKENDKAKEDENKEEDDQPAEEEEQEGEEEPQEEEGSDEKDNDEGNGDETEAEDNPEDGDGSDEGDDSGDGGGEGDDAVPDLGGGDGEEGGDGDFSLDADDSGGEDDLSNEPAPDGLPEADDDGSGDVEEEEAEETNLQTNILQLSKLDRAIAKRKCYQYFVDLQATVTSTLTIIDRNETVIDPDIREQAIDDLNKMNQTIRDYLLYKFQLGNYETNLADYFVMVKKVNSIINNVKNDEDSDGSRKHKNKGRKRFGGTAGSR